jgi:hypothetical protein
MNNFNIKGNYVLVMCSDGPINPSHPNFKSFSPVATSLSEALNIYTIGLVSELEASTQVHLAS